MIQREVSLSKQLSQQSSYLKKCWHLKSMLCFIYPSPALMCSLDNMISLTHQGWPIEPIEDSLEDFLTFIINLSVTVDVCLPDHFIDLLISELLAKVGHYMPQLCCRDEPIAILVKHTECLSDLLFAVRVLHLPCHHSQKLWEVDGPVA